MNTQEYEMLAARTSKDMGTKEGNLVHAQMGIAGEAGEFTDAIKKNVIYGKPLDVQNCIEELGDVLWFVALAAKTLGVSMSQVMEQNINKLKLRYPEKYTDRCAIERADKKYGEDFTASASLNIVKAELAKLDKDKVVYVSEIGLT